MGGSSSLCSLSLGALSYFAILPVCALYPPFLSYRLFLVHSGLCVVPLCPAFAAILSLVVVLAAFVPYNTIHVENSFHRLRPLTTYVTVISISPAMSFGPIYTMCLHLITAHFLCAKEAPRRRCCRDNNAHSTTCIDSYVHKHITRTFI